MGKALLVSWKSSRFRLLPRAKPVKAAPSLQPHYRTFPLLRTAPPLYAASVLCRSRDFRLRVSLGIGVTGSHVPHKSLDRVLAASMPDAARAVSRYPSDLSRSRTPPPVLTPPVIVSTRLQRFTCVRLHDPHLTGFAPCLFPTRSLPRLLSAAAVGWFEASAYTATSGGLPPSLVQHGCVESLRSPLRLRGTRARHHCDILRIFWSLSVVGALP